MSIEWLMVSNAFCKSMRIIPDSSPDSKPFSILSWGYERQESVESQIVSSQSSIPEKKMKCKYLLYWLLKTNETSLQFHWYSRNSALLISSKFNSF